MEHIILSFTGVTRFTVRSSWELQALNTYGGESSLFKECPVYWVVQYNNHKTRCSYQIKKAEDEKDEVEKFTSEADKCKQSHSACGHVSMIEENYE